MRMDKKREELSQRSQNLSHSFRKQQKSKTKSYQKVQKAYFENRHNFLTKIQGYKDHIDFLKMFSKKVKDSNAIAIDRKEKVLKDEKYKLFGRFDKDKEFEEKNFFFSKNKRKIVNKIGKKYLDFSRAAGRKIADRNALSRDFKANKKRLKRETEENGECEGKIGENAQNQTLPFLEKNKKGNEYLSEVKKSNARIRKKNKGRRRINVSFGDISSLNVETKGLFVEKLKKFDSFAEMRERRRFFGAERGYETETLDNLYIGTIKAKLDFLEKVSSN